ncbi:MAG: cupin domain-containing protein, partial [bacterium]
MEEKHPIRLPEDWGRTAFRRFLESEQIPVVTGLAVDDLKTVEVAPWTRLDARGAYIQLNGAEDTDSAYVLEISAGKSSATDQHLYEEVFFVLSGRGSCEVWNNKGAKRTFEWQTGSVFAIPLNTAHRLHNGSGTEATRLLGVTTAPLMFNLLRNTDFIFHAPYDFTDRFSGEDDYFSREGTIYS